MVTYLTELALCSWAIFVVVDERIFLTNLWETDEKGSLQCSTIYSYSGSRAEADPKTSLQKILDKTTRR